MNPELKFHAARIGFTSNFEERYEARVTDIHGRVIDRKSGIGEVDYAFDKGALKPGVYFLSVRVGASQIQTRRYARVTSSR